MEENPMEIERICRLCLRGSEQLNSIHFYGKLLDEIVTLGEILTSVTSLKHNDNDGLPENICNVCTLKLCRSYTFRETCIQNDLKLREKLQANKCDSRNTEPTIEEEHSVFFHDEETSITDEQNQKHEKLKLSEEGKDDENENITDGDDVDDRVSVIYLEVDEDGTDDDNAECEISHTEPVTTMENSEHVQHKNQNSGGIKVQITEDETDEEDDSSEIMKSGNMSCFKVNFYHEEQEEDDEESIKAINQSSNGRSGEEEFSTTVNGNRNRDVPELIFRKRRQKNRKIPGPPYECEVCHKVLRNTNSYKYHMQLHSDATPFLCSHCGEGFKTRNAYDGHMMTHNANNPHTCKICGKAYRQAGSLRSHMLSHTGEKPFVCDICGKGTTQKSGYKKHMLTHTGEKPYKCNICGNLYRYSSNLITHKRRHAKGSNASTEKIKGDVKIKTEAKIKEENDNPSSVESMSP